MGRVLKGGVWTNIEDEVLKAAIMKYGTNQWARVASLLHKKSDKQCKTRWYEWLSPTVKKTEWTPEENEKLLHLGKVLPTQWRTISDSIGRTAAQCVQQYTYLIEKTRVDREGLGDIEAMKQDDTDLRPESRPAKPDPIDMAEDEIDMLNEARARLANTQGKKAKRKGRERQLIMARRLAAVQQKRELAEVGIIGRNMSNNKKKATINYNEEIAFYQPIPKGFHDTRNEKFEATETVIGKRVCDLEFETREEREKKERKKDIDLKRKRMEDNLPDAMKMGEKIPEVKRSKLVLSKPTINDEELQTLLKMGHENEANLQAAVNDGLDETAPMLGKNLSVRGRLADRTPLAVGMTIEQKVDNIRAIHYTKTPLLGGENMALHTTGSVRQQEATQNTSLRANILGTPAAIGDKGLYGTPTLTVDKDGAKYNMSHRRKVTKENLEQLPQPNKDIKASTKRLQEEEIVTEDSKSRKMDQADIDRAREEERRRVEAAEWELRSSVVRRGLPRPVEVNLSVLRPADASASLTELQRADELVKQEMATMLHHDRLQGGIDVPATGKFAPLSSSERRRLAESMAAESRRYLEEHPYDQFSVEELREAANLLAIETEAVKREMGHTDAPIATETYSRVWEECLAQVLYLPAERRFTRANLVSRKDRVDSLRHQLEARTAHCQEATKRARKLEEKQSVLLGGYMARSRLLAKAVGDLYDQIDRAEIELSSLTCMREQEQGAVVRRLEAMETDVERQRRREAELQARYAELVKKRDYLDGLVC